MTESILLNKPRALQYMADCHLDAIVASAPANVGYLSGYFCWLNSLLKEYMLRPGASNDLPESYALLTGDGECALIVPAIFAANATGLSCSRIYTFGAAGLDLTESSESTGSDKDLWSLMVSAASHGTAREALIEAITGSGLAHGTIGLDMDGIATSRRLEITQALPRAAFKDCSKMLLLIRAVKSPAELVRLARSAEITESAAAHALDFAGPGVRIREVVQQFDTYAVAAGAELDHFAFSPRGFGIAIDSDYRLRSDDILYVDFGCRFGHYYSDTGITLALTSLPEPLAKRYAALHACIAAGVQAMRPGTKSSDVQKAMMEEFRSHNFEACFPHGHGVGLEVRDYPILVPDTGLRIHDDCVDVPSDMPLEEGMVNNLEASVFLSGIGSAHIEKTFIVTANGNHALISQDRDRPYFKTAQD